MEPIKADVYPGPSIHGNFQKFQPDHHLNNLPDDPNRPEGFNFDSLQEKAEKIQANMNTRRSTAGAVVVRYHLEPTKVQIFLRCSDQKLDMRRKRNDFEKNPNFRKNFKGSSDRSYFIFEINIGKSRNRHRTTLK